MSPWDATSVKRRIVLLVLGVGLCVLVFWMNGSPDALPNFHAQPLAKSLTPSPSAHMATEAQGITAYALPRQPSSSEILQDILVGSRLSPFWLKARGFSVGSEALDRLHGLMNGHTKLFEPGAGKIAFGPQGSSFTVESSEMPVLATQERYVQATLPLPVGGQGDFVLLRWRNASSNTVIELSAQAIPSDSKLTIPIWMYSANDWQPGRYRVEVISADPSLKLIAAGDFEIAGLNEQITSFSFQANKTIP